MIIEAVCNIVAFVLLGVIKIFPTIPFIKFEFLNGVIRMLSLVDMFVSLRVLSACFVVILVLQNAGIVWGIIMWVVRKIPTVE